MSKRIRAAAQVLAVAVLAASCSSEPEPSLYGTYKLYIEDPVKGEKIFATLALGEHPIEMMVFPAVQHSYMTDTYEELEGLQGPATGCVRTPGSPSATLTAISKLDGDAATLPLFKFRSGDLSMVLAGADGALTGHLIGKTFKEEDVDNPLRVERQGEFDPKACLAAIPIENEKVRRAARALDTP